MYYKYARDNCKYVGRYKLKVYITQFYIRTQASSVWHLKGILEQSPIDIDGW